ncbi:glycosyltransferase [Alkalilimnicola ehrlichii]|uniref:Glycosyl transferase n=1 Tax=Alkalilimnicola ehrlichii TaxID=351052 RepID=A0A3E0WYK3_9GAMM|nr:glycosyltransferase [Alkalilimnicola ehrlichii]RFA37469.1 hypothetical protein CAL65_09290 [Alkalilimnicola ehrlichii]
MRLAIFIPSYGDGGVERMLVNMARGLAAREVEVVFLTGRLDGPHLNMLPKNVKTIHFPKVSRLAQVHRLRDILQSAPVDWLLAAKLDDARVAMETKRLLGGWPRVLLRPGTAVTERLAGRVWWKKWRKLRQLRKIYGQADLIVANSEGVRQDIARATNLPVRALELVRNPVLVPEFYKLADEPEPHPWFADGQPPVILGAGGLRQQKGFDTLIQAFGIVKSKRECRLMILGEGHQRRRLSEQARALGIDNDFALPGFTSNPYPYMRHARVFVLSSRWEGSPNVLTEALALGTPVVSTNCRSGPSEILQDGKIAPLVPVDDAEALADAIGQTLDSPPSPDELRSAAKDYSMEANAVAYSALLHRHMR